MDAILGYIVALTLSMIGVAGFTTWARLGVANVQTAATAGQMLTFDKAAQQYVQDNGSTIAALATATSPVTVTPAMLIAAGYLPNGFSPSNVFGQTWQLQVLQPAAGQLQSLVTSQGGTPISNARQLVQIAAQAGAQGGFVPYANQAGDASMTPANANGAYGGWRIALTNYANPGSGHLASLLAFTNVQSNNAYLYRVAVAGHPELNTMQTALNMGAHDIDSANNVNATTVNANNVNAQGVDVQNPGGTPTVTIGNSKLIGVGSQAVLQADGGTVLTNSTGSAYAPLTAGSIAANGDVSSSGNITASGDVTASGNVNANYVQPNGGAASGQPCPTNGMIGNSGNGPLFCQSHIWKQAGSTGGQYVLRKYWPSGILIPGYQEYCQPNPITGNCSCPGGTADFGYMTGQSYAYSPWDSYYETHFCIS
ncbi:shufflon system plasmid conjugative transfer pilus tip adhesin PilV [Trinickia fusca]|uniref:Shufflon system plasmid conjugative transfer pilus tip adhesin PilV n=1 Tax=Trinickia fusca TaxID=2419777 RepID=A0A494XAM6_9BURK|nr:shufflon system plasmid conjugative transfer pilus tip adhesin PilV [Trinickia fusca]RKP47560.1 shufflon system plasmid conjugative transfer pilus tip adhesin PilV [Trinickia fusca]